MNELKEQIDNQDFTLKLYNVCSDLYRNDQIPDVGVEVIKDLIINDLMQLIETYTAKKELEARKQDIKKLDGMLELKERYGEPKDDDDSEWNEAIHYAINQLSSQLTNNKEGIEK